MNRMFSKGLVLVLGLMVCGILAPRSTYATDYPMRSVTFMPSFFGPGIGTRHWETDKYGWGIDIQPSWGFSDYIYTGNFLYSPFEPTKSKQYFGVGLGGFHMKDSLSYGGVSADTSVNSFAFKIFSGWEWLKGIKKNQGLSAEVGLQFGSADAKTNITSGGQKYSVKSTFALPVIYIGGTYAFYYNKK